MADVSMSPQGEYATISRPGYFVSHQGQNIALGERSELHDKWMNEVVAEAAEKGKLLAEKHAVVMAGAPGIGKGTVQRNQFNDFPGYVVCDPDAFKEKIIEHELRSGNLDALKSPLVRDFESQGHQFAPMEFAALVHEESSLLRVELQRQLQGMEMNFVVDTVLKSEESAQNVAGRLDHEGYTYDVVSVQGTAQESKKGIYGRWEDNYRQFLLGGNDLGGRPVPSEFANGTFPDPNGPSTTQHSAQWLAEHGGGVQRFMQFRRGQLAPEIDQEKVNGVLVSRNIATSRKTLPTTYRKPSSGLEPKTPGTDSGLGKGE